MPSFLVTFRWYRYFRTEHEKQIKSKQIKTKAALLTYLMMMVMITIIMAVLFPSWIGLVYLNEAG